MFIFTSECVLLFSLSEYGYPVVKRTLPACPLSTSCVIHPYCYTDMLTRPSLPLHTQPSTVWLYLSAQRSVLSPLPMLDNRHHRTHTPSDWSQHLTNVHVSQIQISNTIESVRIYFISTTMSTFSSASVSCTSIGWD